MKLKKVMAISLVAAMAVSMAACGSKKDDAGSDNGGTDVKYADIKLGEDYTDLKADITVFNHRTDLQSDEYKGTTWDGLIYRLFFPGHSTAWSSV